MKKPRKKSPPRTPKEPQKAPKNNYFATLMSTPEGRALRREWSTRPRKNGGRPRGTPDGYRTEEIKPIREKAKEEAKDIVNIMSKKYNIEDEYSKEALTTAVEVMRVPGETRERLAAARLVLDFTRGKPASKSEVTLGKAEDFLSSLLLQEEEQTNEHIDDGQETTSSSKTLIN